jgi:ferrochelatase
MSYDAVLLIAFGGPTHPEEVRPFLEKVVEGRNVPPERLAAVEANYAQIGGRSPLLELTRRQAHKLRWELASRNLPLPVYIGMRNWRPWIADTLEEMWREGVRRAIGIILSPLRSPTSWERYMTDVSTAREQLGGRAPEVDYVPPWSAQPGFLQAATCRVAQAFLEVPPPLRQETELIFTAHSLPIEMARHCPYEAELQALAQAIGQRLGQVRFRVAYQSRSGDPRQPWLEPDIGAVLPEVAQAGARAVVVAPVGFVCDHVEVLYDLDVVARQIAADHGLTFVRAQTVNDHSAFIAMLADLVCKLAEHPTP